MRRERRSAPHPWLGGLVAIATVAAACAPAALPRSSSASTPGGSGVPPTAAAASPTDTSNARDDGWRADVDALLAARERLHPDPWHGMARATWVSAADSVKAGIPTLTDDEVLVDLVRLAAMPGWTGREGHTGMFPFIPGSGTHELPIRLWQFSDGLVITTARAPYGDVVGTRVEAIGGRPIAEVLRLVEPLAPRDNASTLLGYAPLYLRVSELLHGLGVTQDATEATVTVVDPAGLHRDVRIEPITAEEDVAWNGGAPLELPTGDALWLRATHEALWWRYLDASRTLYVQYNEVRSGIDGVADEILARARQGDIDRVVVDLRRNGGGDNTTYGHLLAVLQDPAIDRPGRLIVLIGRLTFSAAANFATELERTTGARFAGEAMGGSPNVYGDVRRVDLPYGGQAVFVATRYHVKSTPDDPRITIEPDLPVAYSSADWLAGADPVLEAAIREPRSGE